MSLLDKENIAPAPRRVMTIFYLVDASGSMVGNRIGTVNSAMEESIPMLKEVAASNGDAEIKVAVMQFASGCQWVTPESGPISIEDFVWNDIQAGGFTDFGMALIELDKKLSRDEFLKTQTGAYAPVILLLSDGVPTDDWESGLEKIKENNWFKCAIKIAIDIDGESDREVLSKFTGNPEAILETRDNITLKRMIHKVSVRASEFQSHSKSVSESTPEQDSADIVKEVKFDVDSANDGSIDGDNGWGDNW